MAKKYQVNGITRFVNRLMARMIRWNMAPSQTYLLTVRGRKTGKLYSMPVNLMEWDGKRWLVSPYGEVNWVKNARIVGEINLTRGRKTETYKIQELQPQESAPILQEYIRKVSIVRPYFDVQPDAALETFKAEASRHPVFLLKQ